MNASTKPDHAPLTSGKNIVLCLDGTNNEFGRTNTNVVRLYQSLDRSTRQVVYYDPGVGTLAPPGLFTDLGKAIGRQIDGAIGTGVIPKAEEAVHFLMQNYEPGDRIYLFGFSRGAYTARVVAALLHKSGLPDRDAENLLPYFSHNLKYTKDPKVSDEFKKTFGRPCPVHFLGSSLDRVGNPVSSRPATPPELNPLNS